jgi:putative SOS response-associated peptidase YedK
MCGAFSIRLNPWERAEIHNSSVPIQWQPIYNARPGEWLPIITEEQPRTITTAFWGFVPHWATRPDAKAVINARAETVADKPYFRSSFKNKRCVIPADGFYEWLPQGRVRVPYYFHRKDEKPFLFAGLYDQLPGQKDKDGFVIITTNPNSLVERIHNRMPVMLEDGQEELWLNDKSEKPDIEALLDPYPEKLMSMYQVSQAVNSAKEKSEKVVTPVKL